jgi:hypothetical protein
MVNYTCHHVKLVHVGDLRPVPERLPPDPPVRERAADGDAEVVGPHARRDTVLERGAQDVDPQLLAAGVDPRLIGRHVHAVTAAAQRAHVDDDASWRQRLASGRVPSSARRHREVFRLGERQPD